MIYVFQNMAPLIEARFTLIPTAPGSDWRDLPNKVTDKIHFGTYYLSFFLPGHDFERRVSLS